MKVGIYSHEQKDGSRIGELLKEYAQRWDLEIEVVCFSENEEVLMQKEQPLDALFLEIQREKKDALLVASAVNEIWGSCQIVYLADALEDAAEIYSTAHVFLAVKDQLEDRMGEILGKILYGMQPPERELLFHAIGGSWIHLSPGDVYWLERRKRVTVLETAQGTYMIHEYLSDVEKQISKLDFVRCHNSYLVNMAAVRELGKDCFRLKNGEYIPVSRHCQKKTRADFDRWLEMNK